VDANIIGILIWNLDGEILEANEAFLHTVGYDRDVASQQRVEGVFVTPRKKTAQQLMVRQVLVPPVFNHAANQVQDGAGCCPGHGAPAGGQPPTNSPRRAPKGYFFLVRMDAILVFTPRARR
jgi:hypothetical protein